MISYKKNFPSFFLSSVIRIDIFIILFIHSFANDMVESRTSNIARLVMVASIHTAAFDTLAIKIQKWIKAFDVRDIVE